MDLGLLLAQQGVSAGTGHPAGRARVVLLLAATPDARSRALAIQRGADLRAAGSAIDGVALGGGSDAALVRQLAGEGGRSEMVDDLEALTALLVELAAATNACATTGCGCPTR